MKILVLTSTFSRWKNDTEPKFIDNLCQYLSQEHEVHVIAPHAPGIPREECMDGVQVFRFKYCVEKWQTLAYDGGILASLKQDRRRLLMVPFFLISQSYLMFKLMRRHSYDIVHAHWIIPQGLVSMLTRPFARNRPAFVITSHGGDMFGLKGKLPTSLKKWAASKADQLTVVSSAMKDQAVKLKLEDASRITVIPMGTDSHRMFRPPSSDMQRQGLLFVGRLVEKKGLEHLIAAMPFVLKEHPNQHLTIVGDGPLITNLRLLCEKHRITEHVTFVGAVPNQDIPGYLQRSSVTIFPSIVTDSGDQEGTPVAVMEALACECATVVSDYPGARDIIEEGETGLLVEQKSPVQISTAINYFLDNPEIREKLGAAGRRKVQKDYDWSVIAAKFLALFQVLRKRS